MLARHAIPQGTIRPGLSGFVRIGQGVGTPKEPENSSLIGEMD